MTARRFLLGRALLASGAALLAALLAAAPASAQPRRNFPPDALRGEIVVVAAPEVRLNDAPARLAPGARIRGADNMIALSASLTGYKLIVHYTLDPLGELKDVWILTPAEAARKPWPTTREQAAAWQFDTAAQVWSKP